MKLIDKDTVVAEIESYKNSFCDRNGYLEDRETSGLAYDTLCELEDSIDTLEVKEVDLEKKATQLSHKYFPDEENIWARPNIEAQRCKSACLEMVEWFKVQKGK